MIAPLVTFERIESAAADDRLVAWGHYLGPCDRPFGRQDFGLFVGSALVSVATSASTVVSTCAGLSRYEVVELARLATDPAPRWATRVTLRLWRSLAAGQWREAYASSWPAVRALVSYSAETRHRGDVYRFDGWRKVGVKRGSTGGGRSPRKPREDKALWIYALDLSCLVEVA